MLLREDERINDVYEVDRYLGEGAFAEVYRVKHKYLGRQAMKIFKTPSPLLVEIEQNLAEAIVLSKIGHPNVIRVFDAGVLETERGRRGYFTMEYVAGGTLDMFWRAHGNGFVSLPDTVKIICQVCTGLAVAHSQKPPIVHRDIKPQNILVGYDIEGLRVRIGDFGLAKSANPLTLLASARGTPAFKPPECLKNIDSCASDVWAVGVTLYLLLTDRLPFPVESRMDLSNARCWQHKLVPASEFNPRVDAFLESIVSRSLEISIDGRYPTAMAMLDDLTKWQPPKPRRSERERGDAERSKSALGLVARAEAVDVSRIAEEALRLGKNTANLMEAADLLEEALNRQPELRESYEYYLKLWRRGIVM